jgi:hypothetical protein
MHTSETKQRRLLLDATGKTNQKPNKTQNTTKKVAPQQPPTSTQKTKKQQNNTK